MGINVTQKGDFKTTEKFLKKSMGLDYKSVLDKYARQGVSALSAATPLKSGKTASSWSYEITQKGSSISIIWKNSNVNKGVNIAVILQYGHATRTGGWVEGRDYINPALRPIFDALAEAAWKEVKKL